jgi:hypothetical protein
MAHVDYLAKDFTPPWFAARTLLLGQNPYRVMQATGSYPFGTPFFFPLPAALLAIPFAPLNGLAAGVAFTALSFGVLGFALTREGYERLPLLVSFPAVMAATLGQWSPLIAAATMLPALQFVAAAKPTLGLAMFAYRPSRAGVIGVLVLVVLSFIVLPSWVAGWRGSTAEAVRVHSAPVTWGGGLGVLLVASLLGWRDRGARLLLVMALVPQMALFYDQLLLHQTARTRREMLALVAAGWAGGLVWAIRSPGGNGVEQPAKTIILVSCYLPALLVVMRHALSRRDDSPAPPIPDVTTPD